METNKYSRGKIYKLVPRTYEGEYIPYYGSTIDKYLSSRLSGHKNTYKNYKNGIIKKKTSSYELFENYGIDNVDIILLENYPCNSKYELESRERYYIEGNNCVNKIIPTRSKKEYLIINKEHKKEYDNKYYNENIEKIKEKFNCECGGKYTLRNKIQHINTTFHKNFINNQNNN
jgi:hypothetical protein